MKQTRNYTESASSNSDLFDILEMIVLTMSVVLLFFSFGIRQTVVDGASMESTLFNGERLLITDVAYTPQYGDIVVFQSPGETGREYPLIKRVIAVAGQTVRMETDGFYIDGTYLDEPYAYIDTWYYTYPDYVYSSSESIKIGETYTVPEGKIFVLGDHRNNSADGRVFGFIDERTVLGRVILRMTPLSRFGAVD